MPIAFLAPVFLAGLAAVAIPILIHLANRPKKQVVPFPSLMFLEKVEYRDSSRRRLRNVVLFALRSLALVLLAAAFARPFIDRPDALAAAPDGGREVVVLLDRSASMAVADRMTRAREAVAGVADGLRRGDRATLVVFDRDARAVHRATDQPGVLRRAAADVAAGAGSTRLAPALRLAESLLSGAPLPRRELVVISDFQRTGWDADAATRMPPGTEVEVVDVGSPVENVFVADVRFRRERFSGRDRVRVTGVVAARGAGTDPVTVPVELVLDGRTVATRQVTIDGGGEDGTGGGVTVEFDPVTLPDHAARGTLRAGTDAMPGDNRFHFVLSSSRGLRVLMAEPAAGAGPFLRRALAVGPDHEVAAVRADRLDGAPLADVDVLVLMDDPPDGTLDRIEEWVAAGGGLVVVAGARTRGRTWAGRGLLPGALGGTRDAADRGSGLSALALDQPVFAGFRRGTAGLSAARFYRYRELDPSADARVLARFDDGMPALAETTVGRGRVLTLLSSLDGDWNDLVLQPGFVPLTHGLVRHASGHRERPGWRTVGELLDAAALLSDDPEPDADAGTAPVLLTPSDRARPIERDSLYRLTETGFYEIRDPRSDRDLEVVAVNGDPAESEPARVDPTVVRSAIVGHETAVAGSPAREDQERRQSLWWYFMAGAFVLMAAETTLSNGLSRRPLPRVEGGSP